MKLEPPENQNYSATVLRLPTLLELEGCDNLVAAPLYGFQAIVDKSHTKGELGIVFPPETQLSPDFCSVNGLYRHSELNKDPEAKGYLEDSRRVRAIRLRGHRSDCLFMPIESLIYTGINVYELHEGDTFDRLGDFEICKKYVIKTKGSGRQQQKQEKKFERVDPRLFPLHVDTENYWRNADRIAQHQWVWVSQKLHGSSLRLGRIPVLRKMSIRDRIARRLGVKVQETEYDAIAGSRKVVKDPHNPEANHWYGSDIWGGCLDRVEHLIPENFLVFGEIVGWVDEVTPIQQNYTYSLPPGTRELFIYRVATVNPRGVVTDLSWPQVEQWCADRELKTVPLLWSGLHQDFKADEWIDRRFHPEFPQAIPLGSDKSLVDEGVCVRVDGLIPYTTKAKSPQFLLLETKLLDKGVEDLESTQDGSDA